MKKINYKSDFDFIAKLTATNANGESVEVGFPDYDFELIITSGCNGYSTRSFVASSIGGVTKNCFNDNGQLHIVCDNHKLNVGELFGEFKAYLPNDIYPDGTQLNVEPQSLGIELVVGASDTPTTAEIELQLPYIYQSAYDLAVASGYEGSMEDYLRLSAELPEAVETAKLVKLSADSLANSASSLSDSATKVSEGANSIKESATTLENSATSIDTNTNALTSLVSDWADGKTKIADALTRKYSPTDATESFDAMAQKVMDLPLAVEGQEGIIDHTANGIIDGYDLLNELHKHQRQDYPYCCGVEFVPCQFKTVVLSGAEAYLCSDGFFTTEQEVEHTFAEDNKLSHYIIYYYTYPTYQVPTAINPAMKLIAYNGKPRFILSNYYCPVVQSYTNERYSVGSAEIGLDAGSLVGDIMLSGIETMSGSIGTASLNQNLLGISLPHLKDNSGEIAKNTANLVNINLPQLTTNSGTIIRNCDKLTVLDLPNLMSHSGGNVAIDTDILKHIILKRLNKIEGGYIAYTCPKLEQLELPNVKNFTDGTILQNCDIITSISIPELEECGGTIANICKSLESVSLPNLKKITKSNFLSANNTMQYLELPNLETTLTGSYIVINQGASEIHLPKLRFAQGALTHQYRPNGGVANIYLPVIEGKVTWGSIYDSGCMILVHLGKQQDKAIMLSTSTNAINYKSVTVEQGFRSSLDIHYWTYIPKEDLEAIIDNLADNNDYEPLTLTLGTTLKNKLSEEYIAIATAKNYNIA